ncbi:S-adenosyl-L-methionine-dependent methyltransferase [Mollisia scopiformis]|uniref:Mitochondrial transcription factor 1 n=1 Tax=Mollisia scopiformis TaxID=149040 RepID=A0A194XMK3_MOLSC|nr:S-adenosyl-L-methionine-dependent methyltransferase [Mollisia scopiformis]KUJ21485.1 S-adenosyl-L-methionine-dependent methyltransferase [Mollisia scopiformis]
MFRIVASKRLALLRSTYRSSFRPFHHSAVRTRSPSSATAYSELPGLDDHRKLHLSEDAIGIGDSAAVSAASVADLSSVENGPKSGRVAKRTATQSKAATTKTKTKGKTKAASKVEAGTASVSPKRKPRSRKTVNNQQNSIENQKESSTLFGDTRKPENLQKHLARQYSTLKKRVQSKRMNVVSRSLCDDIIERLKPSLEQYKGCDIIDINPGAGVWSSKLHDHLKPRSHIMMEPDDAVYAPFLQPLVDKPNSTYKLVPKSGIIWTQLEKILTEEYLPQQKKLSSSDPELSRANTSLLVIGNLGVTPRKPYKGFGSLAQLTLYQFLSAMKAHSLFHQYGLIRMLLWVNDEEKSTVLSRSVRQRSKATIEMEIACPQSAEIASSTSRLPEAYQREPSIDFEGLRQVLERMKKNGIKTPPGRESIMMDELAQGTSVETIRKFRERPNQVAKLEEMRRGGVDVTSSGKLSGTEDSNLNKYRYIASSLKSFHRKRAAMRELVEEHNEIMALAKDLHNRPSSKETDSTRDNYLQRHAAWRQRVSTEIGLKSNAELQLWLDNWHCFHEQYLIWDRREFEPLRVRADEFYPQKEMALFDLWPETQSPILRENYPENDEILEFIIAQLYLTPTQSVQKGLGSLWPGAFEWLSEHCPSIKDPTKGGWPDLNEMNIRRLSSDMFLEILEAWVEWPWRPTRWDIMHKLGSEQFDPAAAERDE